MQLRVKGDRIHGFPKKKSKLILLLKMNLEGISYNYLIWNKQNWNQPIRSHSVSKLRELPTAGLMTSRDIILLLIYPNVQFCFWTSKHYSRIKCFYTVSTVYTHISVHLQRSNERVAAIFRCAFQILSSWLVKLSRDIS